MCTYL